MFQALTEDLNATERAAAGIVVLTNQVKDLNKQIRETEKTTQQLSSTLERFERLNRQRFRSAREIQELNELQADLQRRLGTTATGFDLIVATRTEIADNEAEVRRLGEQVSAIIKDELDRNPTVSFSDLIDSDALTNEMKENLPLLYETYARTLIDGFDDLAPEVQRAILRMVQINPNALRDAANETLEAADTAVIQLTRTETREVVGPAAHTKTELVTIDFEIQLGETPEEAFQRAVGMGFIGTLEDFIEAAEGVFKTTSIDASSLLGADGPIAEMAKQVAKINDIGTPEEFLDFLKELRDIDLSGLSSQELLDAQRALPEFFSLLKLPETELGIRQLFERGGITAMRELALFSDRLAKMDIPELGPVVRIVPEFDEFGLTGAVNEITIKTADQVKENLLDAIVVAMLEAEDPIEQLLEFIRDGFQGVSGDVIEALRFESFLIDEFDFASISRRVFEDIEDTNKILELAQKDITQLSQDELNFLATRYPELLAQFRTGTFDALAFEEEARARRADMIEDERRNIADTYRFERNAIIDRLGLSRQANDEDIEAALQRLFLAGEIKEAEANALQFLRQKTTEDLAALDAVNSIAMAEKQATEEIRKRFKVQLDLIRAQQDAIKNAQTIAQLQEDSANIARRSIEATRIGAVGSVEARFNQQQINSEIAKMNRALQDQLQTAQLEAQQKILEDSQQQALENATVNLTNANLNLADLVGDDLIPRLDTLIQTNRTPPSPAASRAGRDVRDTNALDDLERFARPTE